MNAGCCPAEMAVWAPDEPLAEPEQALAAVDHQALRTSGAVAAVALLSVLAAALMALFATA